MTHVEQGTMEAPSSEQGIGDVAKHLAVKVLAALHDEALKKAVGIAVARLDSDLALRVTVAIEIVPAEEERDFLPPPEANTRH